MLQSLSVGTVFWAISALAVSSPSEAPAVPGTVAGSSEIAVEAAVMEGTVEGRVIEAGTGRALAGAQVELVGLGMGTLAGADGRFSISSVPAGEVQVRVQLLGYAQATQTVTVASGESVTVEFQLSQQALALDEVVVTGTAGGAQRRAIGNVVDRISASDITEIAPVTSMTQLIGQRTPGVQLLGTSGQVGSGSRIRIRGTSSIGLSNDPIIYIDGIRMDSAPNRGPSQRGGARVSRLDDLDPESIESIEIIKGPAAATLYGTEASAGVIQIITKRGASASPSVSVMARTGTNWMWNPGGRAGEQFSRDAAGNIYGVNLYEREANEGLGPIFDYGQMNALSANIQGGTDQIRYFASGSYTDDTGVVQHNWDRRFSGRVNLDLIPSESFTMRTSVGFTEGKRRMAQGALNIDPFSNLYFGRPALEASRGFGWAPPEEWRKVQDRSDIDRYNASIEFSHNPLSWFTHRLVAGLDQNQEFNHRLYPRMPEGSSHFFGATGLGSKSTTRIQRRFFTLDYGASATTQFRDHIGSQSSFGLQYYRSRNLSIGATAQQFPAVPITTISGGSTRDGSESFSENATVGVYVQQQFDWDNRIFVTGAVRMDDNSAFGQEFDAAVYPKISATWVMHEEDFWTVDWVSQFRLRGAWGAAGQQPGTFDASRLYAPEVGYNDEPTLIPDAFGNPALQPERGEELEIGFDAEFLDGRISAVFTRFDRWTKDAIVNRAVPRSLGFPGSQVINLGLVRGWGHELGLDVQVMERQNFSWDLGVQASNFRNRIDEIGEDGVIGTGQLQHREGYGIADRYMVTVVSAEIDENGGLISAMCDGGAGPQGVDQGGAPVPCSEAPLVRWGPSQPTWEGGINSTWSYGPLRLYARVDATGGHYQEDTSVGAAITSINNTRMSQEADDPIFQAYRTVGRSPLGTYEAGFARLREVSLTYTLPQSLLGRIGAGNGSVNVAGRNLAMLWTAQDGWGTARDGSITPSIGDGRIWDPETRGSANLTQGYQTVMPPFASATMTVRLGF